MSLFLLAIMSGGSLAYESVTSGPQTYSKETKISGIDISNLTESEALLKLEKRVQEWKEQAVINIETKDRNIPISVDVVQFHLENTIANYSPENAVLSVSIDQTHLNKLQPELGVRIFEKVLLQKLQEDIRNKAQTLSATSLSFSIYDYVEPETEALYTTVSEFRVPIPDDADPSYYVRELNGKSVKGAESFSILQHAKGASFHNETALNVVASAIYGAVLETNFSINQRHINQHRPEYIEKGREASVKMEEGHDLIVQNKNNATYTLELKQTDEEVIAKWIGYPLPHEYMVQIRNDKEVKPRTIVHYSDSSYETELKQKGSSGEVFEVHRIRVDENNEKLDEFISEDYYAPVNRVEVRYERASKQEGALNNETNSNSQSSHDNTSTESEENQLNSDSSPEQNTDARSGDGWDITDSPEK